MRVVRLDQSHAHSSFQLKVQFCVDNDTHAMIPK